MTKNFVYFLITLMICSIVVTLLFNDILSILSQVAVMVIFVTKMKKTMSLSLTELKERAEKKVKDAEKKIRESVG